MISVVLAHSILLRTICRCMASVLLLHVGVDLILEGVVDCKSNPRKFVFMYSTAIAKGFSIFHHVSSVP